MFSIRVFLLVACFVSGSLGHATGMSKVIFTVRTDTLEAIVDVNTRDLLDCLNFPILTKISKSEYAKMSDRVAFYFQIRLELKMDGYNAEQFHVLAYRKKGDDGSLKLDSAAFADTTLVLNVGWSIPKGSRRMEFSSKLFAELGTQAISQVRVIYRDQEINQKFLGLDNLLIQPLHPDSLEAFYTRSLYPYSAMGSREVSTSESESVVWRFLVLGFLHIIPRGFDHILFVLGLFFFGIKLRPLLFQVTAFTVAHSITLGLSLFNVLSLPPRIVEPLIAFSIVIVAMENILLRKLRLSRLLIVFGFGLIHGLGFASVLKNLGLPESQFFKVLLSFNMGVELGQLAVISLAMALTIWMWNKSWYFRRFVIPVSFLIAAIGLFWFMQRIIRP